MGENFEEAAVFSGRNGKGATVVKLGVSVRLGFMGAAHEADFPKLGGEAVALVKFHALREAIKLDVADAGKDGMRGDVRHEKGAEAR